MSSAAGREAKRLGHWLCLSGWKLLGLCSPCTACSLTRPSPPILAQLCPGSSLSLSRLATAASRSLWIPETRC